MRRAESQESRACEVKEGGVMGHRGRSPLCPPACVTFMGYNRTSIIQTNWGFNDPNNQFFWVSAHDGFERKNQWLFRQKSQRLAFQETCTPESYTEDYLHQATTAGQRANRDAHFYTSPPDMPRFHAWT